MATGKVVLKLGDDVSTDIIYPGRFMATVLPSETPQFAFADDAQFNARLKAKEIPPGSFIVAGGTFGCGSSREQAASCIKGYEITVVARNFARIFLQNWITRVDPETTRLVARKIVELGGQPVLRENFKTDNGNLILDVHNMRIVDALGLERELNQIPGVVTCGLFARRAADVVICAGRVRTA